MKKKKVIRAPKELMITDCGWVLCTGVLFIKSKTVFLQSFKGLNLRQAKIVHIWLTKVIASLEQENE